jgi:hypothetical protein
MFITNRMSPGELLAHFLDLRGVADATTAEFQKYRHNNDLCQRFQRNVDALLMAYSSYHADVQDIQSMSDEGVDTLMRYVNDARESRRACLQIKSHWEFAEWIAKRGGSMTEKLIAQHSRAIHNAKIDEYFIVLCTDADAHRNQIRMITSAFKNYPDVRIVLPSKAFAFFQMSEAEITLEVTRLLCSDDPLLAAARKEMARRGDAEAYMLTHLACRALSGEETNEELLFQLFDGWAELQGAPEAPSLPGIEDVVNSLESDDILDRDAGDRINIHRLPTELCALYFDIKHRHRIQDMADYLCKLMEVGTSAATETPSN